MQVLLEKMKYDRNWDNTSTSYSPLHILVSIDKNVLDQTKYQYPFATVHKQDCFI